ncbi:hypothetical protein [Priestia taiwanensis]|uniref:Uncharacterized protein n=1 Tax=Priestia taiwanensis TaxID=1347902 RepID=A0A917ERE2_9BACI|nr:hypothetical protein [Priestia taiwanensis]MBM7364805.1 hypothetical protein [Priestia taiwanensis]GGE79826.1 hypothetical protein GCM10007140_31710 [Priestia taiwanensis]
MKKKILGSILLGILLIPNLAMAFTYSSYYDFDKILRTGELNFNKGEYAVIKTTPNNKLNNAPTGAKIRFELEQEKVFGWSVVGRSSNDAYYEDISSSMKAPEKDTYRVTLKNNSGYRMAGKIKITNG